MQAWAKGGSVSTYMRDPYKNLSKISDREDGGQHLPKCVRSLMNVYCINNYFSKVHGKMPKY